ncbi:MAG: sterol desaturase family protein [Saprospiraceae bacterium]
MQAETIFALFEESKILNYIGLFFLINLGLTLLEIGIDFFRSKKRRWKDTGANLMIFILNQLLEKTIIGSIGVLLLLPFYYLIPWEIEMTTTSWIWSLLAADFSYYWMHRCEHERRFLWAYHSVHHSSEDYNLTVAMRLSLVESLFEWIFLIPMLLIGFNPFQTIISLVFIAQYQTWIHTERIIRLGWLDEIFNTPSVHRVHHGSNPEYLDKNYGGVLIIWDKLFGTFQREEEKVTYGLTKNIATNHPIWINTIAYQQLWKDLQQCRTWKDKFKIFFGNLHWRPSYFEEETVQD